MGAGQRGQLPVHPRRNAQRRDVPAVTGHGRARPVGRQLQLLGRPGQRAAASTPPAGPAGCPGRLRRPAPPAATTRNRHTAPAAAPTLAPHPRAAPHTPPTDPAPAAPSTSHPPRCDAAPPPAHAQTPPVRTAAPAAARPPPGQTAARSPPPPLPARSCSVISVTGRSQRTSAGSRICWQGWPSAAGNTVRSTSCRPATSASAAASATASRSPDSRSTIGML